MNRSPRAALVCLTLLSAGPTASGQQGAVRRVHDPCVIEAGGAYTLFSTGKGIPLRTSRDRVHWELAGRAFADDVPPWARQEIPGATSLWAPDISLFAGSYHLYYSVSTFGSQRSCLGLATSPTLDPSRPDYRWTDRGKVLDSEPGRDDFNAIDPNVVLDEQGTPWLAFGSFFGGLKLVRLDPNTGKPDPAHPAILPLAQRPGDAIEAPFLVRKRGSYYLFASIDHCCRGAASDYKVIVGRAERVTGPYLDAAGQPMLKGGGTLVLTGQGRIRGPGHNAVLTDHAGDWLVHHYYDAEDRGAAKLQIRPLTWPEGGFPVVGEPSP